MIGWPRTAPPSEPAGSAPIRTPLAEMDTAAPPPPGGATGDTQTIPLPRRAPDPAPAKPRGSSVVRNAIALMFSTVATSVLGMVFWTVAARLVHPNVLGRASAATSAVTLLAGLAQLNLANVMPRFVPGAGAAAGRFIARGYLAAVGAGLILSVGYIGLGLGNGVLTGGLPEFALFTASVILLGLLIVQDGVLTALRRATWVPVVKAGFAFAKVGLLPALVFLGTGEAVFVAWSAPVVVAVGVVTVLVFTKLVPAHRKAAGGKSNLPDRRDIASFLSGQYVSSILFNVAYGVAPVLVAKVLGTSEGAFFAIPWLIATSVIALLANIGMSLVAEVSNDTGHLHTHLRRAMRLNGIVAGGGGLALILGAPLALFVFGSAYASDGAMTLRLLGLGLPFAGVTFLYSALNSIDKQVWRTVAMQGAIAVLFTGGSYAAMKMGYGTAGVAGAFVIAQGAVALAVLPQIVATFRTRPDGVRAPVPAIGRGGFRGVDVFVATDTMLMTFSYPNVSFPGSVYVSSAARAQHDAGTNGGGAKMALVPESVAKGVYASRGVPRDADPPEETQPIAAPHDTAAPKDDEETQPVAGSAYSLPEPGGDATRPAEPVADPPPRPGPHPPSIGGFAAGMPSRPMVTERIPVPPAPQPKPHPRPQPHPQTQSQPHTQPQPQTPAERPAPVRVGGGAPMAEALATMPLVGTGTGAAPLPDVSQPVRPAYVRKRLGRIRGLRWLVNREAPDRVGVALGWTALVLCVLTPTVVLLPVPAVAKALVLLAFACFGPGSAVVAHVRLGDSVAAWTVAFLLSISLYAMDSVVQVWTRQWHPLIGLLVLAVPGAVFAVMALAPALAGRRAAAEALPASALPSTGDGFAPRQPGAVDMTAVIPSVGGPSVGAASDTTSVIPAVRAERVDETAVIPLVRDQPGPESTMVIPAVPGDVDQTTVIPAVGRSSGGGDNTVVMPAVTGPAGADRSVSFAVELVHLQRTLEAAAATGTARREATPGTEPPPAPEPVAAAAPAKDRRIWRWVGEIGPLVAGVLLWVYGMTHSDVAKVGDYGLLQIMNPAFFLAVIVTAAGFCAQLARKSWRNVVLVGYLLLMVVILRATVPLMVHPPEWAWTYKHIAVTEFIRVNGKVTDPYDIYQQWPTFFSTAAAILKLSGLDALRLASWAPLFFNLVYCLPLFAIGRTLSGNRRVPWLLVFLFAVGNWVDQDYYSPQAFVYMLCLGVLFILLRWLRRVPGPAVRFTPRWLTRIWAWLARDLADVPYASKRAKRIALATLYLVYIVVATAHQLSPYILALSAGALIVLGLVSPRQLIPVLLLIAILYLVPRQNFAEQYGIFDGFNIFKNAQGTSASDYGSPGQEFSALVVRILSLGVWGSAVLAVIISRRRLGPVAAPAVLAFSPFALLFAQSYGGEAIYRVFLFSLPWCAYLIAVLVLRIRRVPAVVGGTLGAILVAGMAFAGIQGSHGQLVVDRFTEQEITASRYLYAHATKHAAIVLATSDFPSPFTANYDDFLPGQNGVGELIKAGGMAHLAMNSDDLPAVEAYAWNLGGPTSYLVISRSMRNYAHYFGYLSSDALDNLQRACAASPDWKLFYQNRDVVIYQLLKRPPA